MRINLRELRYALRCTKRSGPQPDVILRCRKVPEHDHTTLTVEDTVSPSEATFLSEPEDDAGGALYRRARLDRTKLEQIAERWEETSADLMMTESILRIEKTTAKSLLEIALELESAGPPLYRQLTYTDTPPVTSTDTKTMGDVLDRLERCAPPSGITCIQGARDTPDEIWIEAFDDQRLVAGQAPGTPQADPITLTKTASRRMARMLNDPNRYTPGERVVIRRGKPDEGPETVEMILDRPRPGSGTEDSDRITSARIQWTSRTATAPELMQSAYARLRDGKLESNQIEIRILRKFTAIATALRQPEIVFTPRNEPTLYAVRSTGEAPAERAAMELAVNGELAPHAFAVAAEDLGALVNAMPEWQSSVSLNTLVDDDGEIEALMIWAGERVTSADAYGVARTLPRRS